MLRKPILPLALAISTAALTGCDNDKSATAVSGSSGATTSSFTVCVNNSNATAANCSLTNSSASAITSSEIINQSVKDFFFNPAYAAAVTGVTNFFVVYVDVSGNILSTPAAQQASVSTSGLADGFYQVTVSGDPTEEIANGNFPVLVTDLGGTLALSDITSAASLTALDSARNASGLLNVPFTFLADISDDDSDGVVLDRISTDISKIIISNNSLSSQTFTTTTLNTFVDTATSSAIKARTGDPEDSNDSGNADADLTQIVTNSLPEADQTVQTFENMVVNGTVSGSATAQAAANSTDQGVNIANASINIRGLDQNGTEMFTAVTESDENGLFNLNIPTITNSAESYLTRIEIRIEKEGYIVGEKVLTEGFSDGATLSVRALLGQETVVTQSRDQLAITASGERSFRLGLVKYSNGEVAAVAGKQFAEARASADASTLLDMAIPEDCVPAETTAVTARVGYFDPNNPTDVQSFPGEFEGTGDTADAGSGINLDGSTNEENYRLVSSVFSQVKLENQNGDNLSIDSACGNTSGAEAAAEGDAAVMTLQVPLESYDTITEDTDENINGIQVPIYIYSGGWKFAGNGTLMVLNTTDPTVDYDLYDGTVPPDTNTTPELFVQITVTDGNEWIQWVNLDWPIRPISTAQTMCLNGALNFDGRDATDLEPFSGSLEIESPSGFEWAYVNNGNLEFTSILADDGDPNTTTDPTTFTYRVWNWRTNQYETLTATSNTPEEGSDCDFDLTINATLENPLQCVINGTVTKSDNSAAQYFWLEFNAGNQFFNWSNTDNQGNYTVGAPCDQDGTLYVANQTFSVSSANFGSDGTQTIDIQLENAAPEVWAWGPYRVTNGETVGLDVYAWDFDDTDLTITADCSAGGSCSQDDNGFFSFTADTVGTHTLTFTATDDEGATGTYDLEIIVDPTGNKPPRINSFQVDGAFGGLLNGIIVGPGDGIETKENDTVTITVNAFDPDADPLTYAWMGCDTDSTSNTCVVTAGGAGSQEISVTVTDNPPSETAQTAAESDSASMTLQVVADQVPFVGAIYSTPALAIDGGNGNTEAITFKAFVDDDFTAPADLIFSWDISTSDGTAQLASGSDAELVVATGTLTAGTYTATVTVTDNNGSSSSQSTTYVVQEHQAPTVSVPEVKNALTNEAGDSNAEAIVIIAVAEDDLTPADSLTFSWEVTGTGLTTPITGTAATLEIPAAGLPAGSYTATVTVGDGPEGDAATKTTQATVTINVFSTPAETTVVIQ